MDNSFKLLTGEKGNIVRAFCLVAVILMVSISVFIYGAPIGQLAIMTAFFLFYIQLPGMYITKWAGLDKGHISTFLITGAFAGWALTIALYFIADVLRNSVILLVIGPLMSAGLIWSLVRDRRNNIFPKRFSPGKLSIALCLFIMLVLLYCLLETQYLYLSPALSDYTSMNADKAYHMGLINSLSHDYPLQSPWISGVMIYYHIFSEMMLSIPVRLFGAEADFVTQSFGPLLTTYFFGTAYYSFFREMMKFPKRAGLYCLIVLLSNIYVTRNIRTSIAYIFALTNDNSSGYGIAAALVTIIIFDKWYNAFSAGDRNHWKLLLLCTAFATLTTGIKGPIGAVAVLGIWSVVVLGILLRKVSPKTVFPLLIITAGFLLVYMTILGSKGQSNASGESVIAFAKIADIAFWKKPLLSVLKRLGLPKIVRYPIMLLVFAIFYLSIFFIPFCIGYIRELVLVLTGRKEYEPGKVLVYAEFAIGFIAMMLLNYSGHSQIYFGLIAVFLAPAIAFWFLEDLEEKSTVSESADRFLGVCAVIMAAMLIFSAGSFSIFMADHISSAVSGANPHPKESLYMSVSKDEYEAMEWIEDNTEADALLATDRYYSVAPKDYSYENRWANRFFLYGVYSNRFIYIGGSGYNMKQADWPKRKEMIETNSKLYDVNNASRGDLARELGVDYVVVSKRFTKVPNLENKDYELCFSNKDVDIYKVAE